MDLAKLENKKITVDHSLLLLALNQDETHGETILKILQKIEEGKVKQAYLSAWSYTEILLGYAEEEVFKRVQLLLRHFPNLTIVSLDSEVAELTASAQRKYQLSFQEATLVATALKTDSDIIITAENPKLVSNIEWMGIE